MICDLTNDLGSKQASEGELPGLRVVLIAEEAPGQRPAHLRRRRQKRQRGSLIVCLA